MTKVLKMGFLGPVSLILGEEPLSALVSVKAQALLCYLAVNGRSQSRQALATLLWSDLPEADALRNLRGDLHKLRQVIGDYLIITHQTVGLQASDEQWVDVVEFQRTADEYGSVTYEELQTAVSLYRGDFLDSFYIRQAPLFEEWVQQQRITLRNTAVRLFSRLAEQHSRQQNWPEGIEVARRLLTLDSTREASHRLLMRLLAEDGQRSAALQQFELCREQLAAELGIDVAPETAALAEKIRAGLLQRKTVTASIATLSLVAAQSESIAPTAVSFDDLSSIFIAGPPITRPAQFFGREPEIKRLFRLLRQRPLQNAAIIGPRRSGKTSLLHYLRTITTTPPEQLRPGQVQDWLSHPHQYRWVFVDFQDPRLGSIDALLRYLLNHMQLPIPDPCTLDDFLDTVSDNLQHPTIILFDEIGVALERYDELDDAFWESLRSLATNQVDGNLAFVLASHESPNDLAQHQGLGSPFFNIFGYTAVLGPLSVEAAHSLIAASPLPIPPEEAEWMLQMSGRWPMPLQILCRECLIALEDGELDNHWRQDALRQATPFLQPNP
jgi:DNA-binding SARP family transcriptional activator